MAVLVASVLVRSDVVPQHVQWRTVRPNGVHCLHPGVVEVQINGPALGVVGSAQVISRPSFRVGLNYFRFANEWAFRGLVVRGRVAISNQLGCHAVREPASLVTSIWVRIPALRLHGAVLLRQ
jgi:hypothetical protein